VADDELGHRELARYLLEPMGFDVVTAANGRDAVALCRQRAFDLVILDVHMPVMQGPHALAHILLHRPAQRVVVVTGSAFGELPASVAAGACALLYKPLAVDELAAVVERFTGVLAAAAAAGG